MCSLLQAYVPLSFRSSDYLFGAFNLFMVCVVLPLMLAAVAFLVWEALHALADADSADSPGGPWGGRGGLGLGMLPRQGTEVQESVAGPGASINAGSGQQQGGLLVAGMQGQAVRMLARRAWRMVGHPALPHT